MCVCVCVFMHVCLSVHWNIVLQTIAVNEVRGSNSVLIVGVVLGALVLILLLMLAVSFIRKCGLIKCPLQGKPYVSSKYTMLINFVVAQASLSL